MSVAYLSSEFLRAMGLGDSSSANVYDIEPKIRAQSQKRCPRDNRYGAAKDTIE